MPEDPHEWPRRSRRRPTSPWRAGACWSELRAAVGKAVVGGDEAVRLVAIALLADGHVLIEDVPGSRQDAAGPRLRAGPGPRLRARPGHARPAPERRDRAPASSSPAAFRFVHGPGLHQRPAGRRDQPGDAAHAVGAAGGDAGAPGLRSRARPGRCPIRSSCWRPRTRSSSRARSRCPRRSSTGSSSGSGSATRIPAASAGSPAATRTPPIRSTPWSRSSTGEPCSPLRDRVPGRCGSSDEVEALRRGLVRGDPRPPGHRARRQPAGERRPVPRRAGRGRARRPRLRDPRRREGRRAGRAGASAHAQPRPHASTARRSTRCWRRSSGSVAAPPVKAD